MDWNEYVKLAERTANRGAEDTDTQRLVMCALGLIGEAGEICDSLKKAVFHSHEFNRDAFIKELGDELWYVAIAASTIDIDLESYWDQSLRINVAQITDPVTLVADALNLGHATGLASKRMLDADLTQVAPSIAPYLALTLTSIGRLAKAIGSSINEVAEVNIAKLRARYPEGFRSEHSINRAV